MSKVDVNPDLLKWARSRARLEVRDLAARFPKYEDWEQGQAQPTFRQLEDFARATDAPLGYLFLDEPPREQLDIPDFRTVRNQAVESPSPELLDTLHAMERRQDWMRDDLKEEGHEPLPFVGSASKGQAPETVAASMRDALHLQEGWAEVLPNWEAARAFLRKGIENLGVLVVINGIVGNNTHRVLDPKEFRGFVLADPYAPLLFVNGADAKAAQIFTMAHELAHLWLGQSALFDLPRLLPGSSDTERFCNQAAAEFLVPQALLRPAWEDCRQSEHPFEALARQFKVSEVVIALRALELNLITKRRFTEFHDEYLERAERRSVGRITSGGDFWRNQAYRVGDRFAQAVISATKEGRLLYRDAFALLDLKGHTFEEYARRLDL